MDIHVMQGEKKEEINLSEGHEKFAVVFFIIFVSCVLGFFILLISKANSVKSSSQGISSITQTPLQFDLLNNNTQQNQNVEGTSSNVSQPEGPIQPTDIPLSPTLIPTSTIAPNPTSTPVPPAATNTPAPSNTPTPSSTPTLSLSPTPTSTPSATPNPTPKSTITPTP